MLSPTVYGVADELVDLVAGRPGEIVNAARQDGLANDLGRPVALVGDPDELVLEPEGADDLGRGGKEGGDAHGSSVGGSAGSASPRRSLDTGPCQVLTW